MISTKRKPHFFCKENSQRFKKRVLECEKLKGRNSQKVFKQFQDKQFKKYNTARMELVKHPEVLFRLEEHFCEILKNEISKDKERILNDYNEASYLFPFWKNYPPEERGRDPKGDQYPWIEVGEHAVGDKLIKYFGKFKILEIGLPSGADQRFVLQSDRILALTNNLTDKVWLHIDIKSVGPRDNFEHLVMGHNQITGNGEWDEIDKGLSNKAFTAVGSRRSHKFYPSLPPLIVLSDLSIVPILTFAVKPIYLMLDKNINGGGQPISEIKVISIPNGLLLFENPNLLKTHPTLFFPGKDDKGKNPRKLRARISFDKLRDVNDWRIQIIDLATADK